MGDVAEKMRKLMYFVHLLIINPAPSLISVAATANLSLSMASVLRGLGLGFCLFVYLGVCVHLFTREIAVFGGILGTLGEAVRVRLRERPILVKACEGVEGDGYLLFLFHPSSSRSSGK